MSFWKWLKLLWQNRFRVGFRHILKAIAITFLSFMLSPLIIFERLIFRKRIKKVEFSHPPIFIIGHWRSGTTHLHNLLARDDHFVYPTIVDTIFPSIFLSWRKFISFLVKLFLPKKRPSDNVIMTLEEPQEHEYALANLCLLSPFIGLLFTNNRDRYLKYSTFENATEKERKEWEKNFLSFLRKLMLKREGDQLLLKSPIDTFRIKILLELFPDAKFIHIYRNPYRVFFSTMNLYEKNSKIVYLQTPKDALDEFVFDMYTEMYTQFYKEVDLIPEGNFFQISYEELVVNRLGALEKIYERFSLPSFSRIQDKLSNYLASIADYKTGKYPITDDAKRRIYSHWHETIDRWGYEKPPASSESSSRDGDETLLQLKVQRTP